MVRKVRDALTLGCALALANLATVPVRAEFPPEGAISDPNNPSIASGDYPDLAHNGVNHHYIFYFDCAKRDWIGVSVAAANQSSPPHAIGNGREFPPGPPPGAKVDAGNLSHATVARTGQTYSLRRGVWFDAKTGKAVASSKLCPESASTPDQIKHSKDSERPDIQKPDSLPPPPKYNIPDPARASHP
jgi:hypothetical protein